MVSLSGGAVAISAATAGKNAVFKKIPLLRKTSLEKDKIGVEKDGKPPSPANLRLSSYPKLERNEKGAKVQSKPRGEEGNEPVKKQCAKNPRLPSEICGISPLLRAGGTLYLKKGGIRACDLGEESLKNRTKDCFFSATNSGVDGVS